MTELVQDDPSKLREVFEEGLALDNGIVVATNQPLLRTAVEMFSRGLTATGSKVDSHVTESSDGCAES